MPVALRRRLAPASRRERSGEALPHFVYQLRLCSRWNAEAKMPLLFPPAKTRAELERVGFVILRPALARVAALVQIPIGNDAPR